MNPLIYIPLVSSIFVTILGVFVLTRNIKSKLNILFMLFCLPISIWLFGTYRMFLAETDQEAMFWDRFIYMGVVFIPILMHHFSIVFGKIKNQGKLLIVGYILAAIFLALSRTDYFVKDLYKYRWGCHMIAQPVHHVFLLVFWGYVVLLNYNIYHFYKITKSAVERNQAKYIFTAFMVLFAIGACAYLPAYKISVFPFPFISGVIFSIILAYAIAKHKILDIHFVIRKLLTNTALVLLLSAIAWLIYVLKINIPTKILLSLLASYIVTAYLQKLKTITENVIINLLYKGKYKYLDKIEIFVDKLVIIPKEEDLIRDTIKVLTRDLYAEKVFILILDRVTNDYTIKQKDDVSIQDDFKLLNNDKIVSWLKQHRETLVLEEEENHLPPNEIENIKKELEPLQAKVCVPACLDSDLIGIITLGNKSTGEMYTHIDLELLTRLGTQLAVALDYKRIEAQLRKEQELVSIGQLSMEISHEMRNLLQSPRTFLDLALERRYDDEFYKEFRTMALERMKVASNKLDDIMYFGRERPADLTPGVDINSILDSNIKANDLSIKKQNIEIIKEYSDIPKIKADSSQLTHLFNNLILNAADAMTGKVGKLRIRAVENTAVNTEMQAKSDKWVRIEVKDDGGGIPQHVMDRLFTPFVTTKSLGNIERKGTGLGLPVVKKVVDMHNGYIHVHTKEGRGTTFVIDLPVDLKPAYITAA